MATGAVDVNEYTTSESEVEMVVTANVRVLIVSLAVIAGDVAMGIFGTTCAAVAEVIETLRLTKFAASTLAGVYKPEATVTVHAVFVARPESAHVNASSSRTLDHTAVKLTFPQLSVTPTGPGRPVKPGRESITFWPTANAAGLVNLNK